MSLKTSALSLFGKSITRKIRSDAARAVVHQERTLKYLVGRARNTSFGKDHNFAAIKTSKDFCANVPLRDYEGLRSYIEQILKGKQNVLWPGMPKYFAKTSGTTSGVKYIPISKESMPFHIQTARNATFNMCQQLNAFDTFDGKVIFLSGSPVLSTPDCGVKTGRLSGIVNHEVPNWITKNQLPSYQTNCIEDWEMKLEAIVEETSKQDMRLISGIPPWVQMYFERLLEKNKVDTIKALFPNFRLFVYGGVNYAPYRQSLEALMGESVPSLETYPASEGFIAFQDKHGDAGLLLNTNAGIYYEFVPLHDINSEEPERLTLSEVELDKDYAVLLSTNAGLWAYSIGDTIRFVSKDPYRIIVSGRIKHFISAFGEHVIGKEVERAMVKTCEKHGCNVVEFTVAPQVNPEEGLPFHQWFVEWEQPPLKMTEFSNDLDHALRQQNIYYDDLIKGAVLRPLILTTVPRHAFRNYMESQGKLGGQNKVPRLANDRQIVDQLETIK